MDWEKLRGEAIGNHKKLELGKKERAAPFRPRNIPSDLAFITVALPERERNFREGGPGSSLFEEYKREKPDSIEHTRRREA